MSIFHQIGLFIVLQDQSIFDSEKNEGLVFTRAKGNPFASAHVPGMYIQATEVSTFYVLISYIE